MTEFDLPFIKTGDGSIVLKLAVSEKGVLKLDIFPTGEIVVCKQSRDLREYDEWELTDEMKEAFGCQKEAK